MALPSHLAARPTSHIGGDTPSHDAARCRQLDEGSALGTVATMIITWLLARRERIVSASTVAPRLAKELSAR